MDLDRGTFSRRQIGDPVLLLQDNMVQVGKCVMCLPGLFLFCLLDHA